MVFYKIYENVHGASNIVKILIIYNISFMWIYMALASGGLSIHLNHTYLV